MTAQANHRTPRRVLAAVAAIVAVATSAMAGTASAATHPAPLGWASAKRVAELTVLGSDELGFAVAISGDGKVAVVGTAGEDAFVFTKAGKDWEQAAELAASDGAHGDDFGSTVAVSRDGSTILVGAVDHDDTGAAYLFTRWGDDWTQTAELKASDPVQFGGFSWSLSLSADGSTALVGANGQGVAGEAYVFRESGGTWTQTAVLSPSGGGGDAFGDAVALSADGSMAAVGAPLHGGVFTDVGAAYVFGDSGGGWTQTAELGAADGAAEDEFGDSIAVSRTGSVVVVGSANHDRAFGAAFVFTGSGGSYTQTDELTASDGSGFDFFGGSLAVSANGSVIAVGAPLHHHQAGAEYVYVRGAAAWTQRAELTSTRRREPDWFGSATGLSSDGSTLLVGAFARGPFRPGSAFVFTR